MAEHLPSLVWSFYPPGRPCNSYVRTANTVALDIELWGVIAEVDAAGMVTTLRLPRKQARMLARRIDQCLDATKGRH
jgi:hypothetical protein